MTSMSLADSSTTKFPPNHVYWVDLRHFQNVGGFFVRVDDAKQPWYVCNDTLLLLEMCEQSKVFDTPQKMRRFHESRNNVMRTINKCTTNMCKKSPVLHVDDAHIVGSVFGDRKAELSRFTKFGIDAFNRNTEKVFYPTGNPPNDRGETPCFAAAPCQINHHKFMVEHATSLDLLQPKTHSKRRRQSRLVPKATKETSVKKSCATEGGVTAASIGHDDSVDGVDENNNVSTKRPKRRPLTESNHFVPTLRCRGTIHFGLLD